MVSHGEAVAHGDSKASPDLPWHWWIAPPLKPSSSIFCRSKRSKSHRNVVWTLRSTQVQQKPTDTDGSFLIGDENDEGITRKIQRIYRLNSLKSRRTINQQKLTDELLFYGQMISKNWLLKTAGWLSCLRNARELVSTNKLHQPLAIVQLFTIAGW